MLMLNYWVRKTDDPDFLKTDKISHIKIDWNFISVYFPYGSDGKVSAYNSGDPGSIPGSGRSPGEGMATHSSILAWKIPWTEEPGGLQSTGSQRVGHNWATSLTYLHLLHFYTSWSIKEDLPSHPRQWTKYMKQWISDVDQQAMQDSHLG